MPVLNARLLGPPDFDVDGRPIHLSAGKARALFCYLAATRQVHSRDRLAGFFWPDVPERNALSSLRTALYDIRRALGEAQAYLFVERTRVAFRAELPYTMDLALLEQVSPEHEVPGLAELQRAVDVAGAPFLEGLSLPDAVDFDDWVFLERERLTNLYLLALVRLGSCAAASGQWARAADAARRVLAVDPLREDVQRQLMRFLVADGQRSAALAQFRLCAEVLDRELGIAPLAATLELYQRILSDEPLGEEPGGPAPMARAATARLALPDTVAEPDVPLVGRRDELAVLAGDWRRAAAGRGGTVVLSGEAGIGKSRLAAALLETTVADGALCLAGRCYEASVSEPYGPIAAALRSALAQVDVASLGVPEVWLREMVRLVPELGDVVGAGQNVPLDGLRDRDRLFESVRVFLSALAAQRPVVLIIEDVHWADETSLSVLISLTRHVAALPLLLVVTYRGEDVAAEQRRLVRALAGAGRRLELSRLSEAETAQLVSAMAALDSPPVQFGRRLHQATSGNPLFVVEIVRALFEQGSLRADEASWLVPASAAQDAYAGLPVPESVGFLIDARLDRLPDDARTMLDCAAVLRREFAFDLVRAASGVPAPAALDNLDVLIGQGLLREREAPEAQEAAYDFAHALVRDRVYQSLTSARRQYLHRQVAGLLEATLPAEPDRVAYHYLRGGVRDRACAWSLKAGEAALKVYAFENGLVHFGSARELAVAPSEEYRALAGLGDAHVGLGRPAEAIPNFRAALAVAPDAAARAELLRRIGRANERQGAFDLALDAYADARRLTPGKPDSAAAVRLLDGLATVYVRLGRFAEAAGLCQEALDWVAEQNGAPEAAEAEAWVRNTLGMAFLHAADYPQAVANLQRSRALKRQLGDRLGEATLLNNLGVVYYHCGEDAPARDFYVQSLAIKESIGDTYGAAIALTNLALIETHLGEYDAAGEHLTAAEASAGTVGAGWLTPEIQRVAAQRYLAIGDHAAALRSAEEALASAEELGVPAFIGVAHRVLGQVKAAGFGDVQAADEHFETSLAVFEMLENEHELAKTHAAYGEILAADGRAAAADDHLKVAMEVFRRSGARGRLNRIEPLLGDR
jgi:predicted ATPase/DNA-binding SARP family transcriptional activator